MTMAKLKHTLKTDILFKLFFTKYPHLLKHLISKLLKIPLENIHDFKIVNPEMPPDIIENKFCRLDILMRVDDRQINLEVQVEDEGDFPERVLFHWARAYSNALPVGGKHIELPQTILINILAFSLFKDYAGYHSEFQVLEVTRNVSLTDKMVIHFFELEKLPKDVHKDDSLLLWLKLFEADTEEEIKMIEDMGETEVSEAVVAYRSVTTSEQLKEIERMRILASHNEASALHNAAEKARKAADEKWQSVVDEKDAEIAKKEAENKRMADEIVKLNKKLTE